MWLEQMILAAGIEVIHDPERVDGSAKVGAVVLLQRMKKIP